MLQNDMIDLIAETMSLDQQELELTLALSLLLSRIDSWVTRRLVGRMLCVMLEAAERFVVE